MSPPRLKLQYIAFWISSVNKRQMADSFYFVRRHVTYRTTTMCSNYLESLDHIVHLESNVGKSFSVSRRMRLSLVLGILIYLEGWTSIAEAWNPEVDA